MTGTAEQGAGDVEPRATTSEPHSIVWVDLVGCGSARRPTIKVPAVRADLVAGSAYFAAMLDGPYRESRQTGPVAIDIPPLRDAIFVLVSQRGRRRKGAGPCPAERLCSVFVRTIARDGRPPEACDVLLLWRALCFVGASSSVLETCAYVVHDAMGLLDFGDDRPPDIKVLSNVSSYGHRVKRTRVDVHTRPADHHADTAALGDHRNRAMAPDIVGKIDSVNNDDDGDENRNDLMHSAVCHTTAIEPFSGDTVVDREDQTRNAAPCTVAGSAATAMTSAMPPIAVIAHLYTLLGGSVPTVGGDGDGDDGTVRDPIADVLLPDPWAHFGLDWARTLRSRAVSYMRFGQQVIQDTRGTLCDALWCASPEQSMRALIAMMRDWATALWPAERLGFVTTAVDAFEHRLAKAVLPDAAPAHFASAVIRRFPVFGPVFFNGAAESALGVFNRLPRGVVLAGGCALYALCRSSLVARRHQCDGTRAADDGVEYALGDDTGRYLSAVAQRTIETCGSAPPGDIDLFIVGPSDSARRAALAAALGAVMDTVPECQAAVGSSVITLWTPRSPDERLQLVFTDKTHAEAVPAGFDMTHLGVACSRDISVRVSWGTLHALVTGTTCTTPGRVVEPEREQKALTRGFTLVDNGQRQCQQAHQRQHQQRQQYDETDMERAACVDGAGIDQDPPPFGYEVYDSVDSILAHFAYGQVVNDNYCTAQPRAHARRPCDRVAQPLGDTRLNLMRVDFAARCHHVVVDRAPAAVVLCPTICSVSDASSLRHNESRMRLTIKSSCTYGDVTPSSMAAIHLRRAEVDLVRRATEVRAGPQHVAAPRRWCGKDRGLTLDDGCAAVLSGIAPPWWTSPLASSGPGPRNTRTHVLDVHVTAASHLTDGVTGRRITAREVCDMGDASVAATVVMSSVVCDGENGGPFFAVATLVAAAFYPLNAPAILDALKGVRA